MTDTKKKSFGFYAAALCILGVVFMFLYSGLQNDQINIIQGFSAWSNTSTQLPMTVGNFVCIILTFIFGTCFIKFGVRKTLVPCIIVCALGCVGIAAANGLAATNPALQVGQHAVGDPAVSGNYILFWVALFAVRCACMCLQMAGFQLAASWFIRLRGRALGVITLGSPLFSLIGTSGMTTFITKNLGGDYRPFYIAIAVLLVVVALLVVFIVRDTPEEVGLYPDGANHPPMSEQGEEEIKLSVGQVLAQKKSWLLICNFGAFQFIINACMGSMVVWFTYLCVSNAGTVAAGPLGGMFAGMGGLEGAGAMALFVGQAVKWLTVGVLAGIPMSFIFGIIDDKLGTPIASLILGITEFLPVIGLMTQASSVASTGVCSTPMLVLWGFGVACMTGGVPTMHPASVSFVFGRREYQSANRVIMAIQLIPSAVAAMMMTILINQGSGVAAYGILLAVIVFGIITTLPMLKMRDANAEDRALATGPKK